MADGDWRDGRPDFTDLLQALETLRIGLPLQNFKTRSLLARQGIDILRRAAGSIDGLEEVGVTPGPTASSPPVRDSGARPKRADGSGPCIYTGKGMARLVFEFLVLRWLDVQGDIPCDKGDIYEQLSDREALDIGTPGAFSTRLAQLKELGWISWPDNKQLARIELTASGRVHLKKLMDGELKPAFREYLANTITWSGLRGV